MFLVTCRSRRTWREPESPMFKVRSMICSQVARRIEWKESTASSEFQNIDDDFDIQAALKVLIERHAESNHFDNFKDGVFHSIFEALFKVAHIEKQSYLVAKSAAARAKAEGYLQNCADVLRLTIKVGAEKLKRTTIKALLEHVMQLLPVANGEYCPGLKQFYLKVLGSILGYGPNVENLETDDWTMTVDFCLEGIRNYDRDDILDNTASSRASTEAPFPGCTSSKHSLSKLSVRSITATSSESSITRKNSEELLECISYLVSASNAPMVTRAEGIFSGIMHFLRSHSHIVSHIHQVAFSAINAVLTTVSSDMAHLILTFIPELVSIIGGIWMSKSLSRDEMLNSVRDELLITILHIRLHSERILKDNPSSELALYVEELETVLRNDYARRNEESQLQLSDLDLGTLVDDGRGTQMTLKMGKIRLRPHMIRTERKWALLKCLSILEHLIYVRPDMQDPDDFNELIDSSHPRKRRRITQKLDRITDRLISADTGDRLVALQLIPFILPDLQLREQSLIELIKILLQCLADKRGDLQSWTLLALASCAQQDLSVSCSYDWTGLWHSIVRLITSSSACRAASFLLHSLLVLGLIHYKDIAEDIDDIIVTNTEISAPVMLCDASISFITHLLSMRNAEIPRSSSAASQRVLRWLSSRFNPNDKYFAMRYGVDIYSIDMLNILRSCVGLPRMRLSCGSETTLGIIGQSWKQQSKNEQVIRYLLLLDPLIESDLVCPHCSPSCSLYGSESFRDHTVQGFAIRQLVIDLFFPKFESVLRNWNSQGKDESTRVSSDNLRSGISLIVLGHLIISYIADERLQHISEKLEVAVGTLGDLVLEKISVAENFEFLSEPMLQAIQPYLPTSNPTHIEELHKYNEALLSFFSSIAGQISSSHPFSRETASGSAGDTMEVDDMFDSQPQRSKLEVSKDIFPRRIAIVETSFAAFSCVVLLRIKLISSRPQQAAVSNDLYPAFVEHVVSLETRETLLCSQLLLEVFDSDFVLSASAITKFVEHLAVILQNRIYNTCEVTQKLCIGVLAGSVPNWSRLDAEKLLADDANQLYEWLVTRLLPKLRPSFDVQISLAELLFGLIRLRPTYGADFQDSPLPSAQSCFFDILRTSPIIVRFDLSRKLPDFFGCFLLKDHSKILDDVMDSLPDDGNWVEGIAFRLHAVSLLASKWPTLIRQCTYYILEVPGNIPGSVDYALRSVTAVADALGLQGAESLFRLFASQLLYTWLISEKITELPYKIFGYPSLRDLVLANQEEITGLMAMRNQDDQVDELAELLDIPGEDLLKNCFVKVMAYGVAHDISVPRIDKSQKHISGEARLRKRLGNDMFLEELNRHFVDIIALLFNLTDQEEKVDQSFAKNPSLAYAADILNEIKKRGASTAILPPNQQPAFKAKFLATEIEHLCRRTEYDISTLFNPAMVVFIARRLLNTVHAALGSLHSCAVLRKLRILVALSGATATSGYPLEMLLQSLTSFMIDPECVDDAVGIAQFLMHHGHTYLASVPSFVLGISISISASLRGLLDSAPSSTTQQSQHCVTISKAQNFQNWLSSYLVKYETRSLSGPEQALFRSFAQAVCTFTSPSNASRGTSESDLLRLLLEDQRSDRKLLQNSSRYHTMSLLYSNFNPPDAFRNDLLGRDTDALAFAPSLWDLCRNSNLQGCFLIWAGKIFGRAFAASGHVHQKLKQESNICHVLEAKSSFRANDGSKSRILQLIQTLTVREDGQTAGLAEAALRVMLSFPSSDSSSFTEIISIPLHHASVWAPYHVPHSDTFFLELDQTEDPYGPDAIINPRWSRWVAISMARSIPSKSILSALQGVISQVKGFAEEVFSFVVHLVLAEELDEQQPAKKQLSEAMRLWICNTSELAKANLVLLIDTLLYLRTQPLPREKSSADRIKWLDVDYSEVAQAAVTCGMYKTALLFYELSASEMMRTSRRSSAHKTAKSNDTNALLSSIYKNIDDPDIFYGLPQKPNLDTILTRLEYEKDGLKSMAFRGAKYDTHLRQKNHMSLLDSQALVNALGVLGLDGVSHSLLQSHQVVALDSYSVDRMFETARRLEQWDLPVPRNCESEAVSIYKAFQTINGATGLESVRMAVDDGLNTIMSKFILKSTGARTMHNSLQSLAVLAEMDEVLSVSTSEDIEEILSRFESRKSWMKTGKFDDFNNILSCRATFLSMLSQQASLRAILNVSPSDIRLVEVRSCLLSSQLNRSHGALQEVLKSATYLDSLVKPCLELGLQIDAAARLEAADALWEQGEMGSSIGMLQDLEKLPDLNTQSVSIGRPDLLAKIGYQVSLARLEKPDTIIERYLNPALKELKGQTAGNEAAHVFHEFASFCDRQLQDPATIEDLNRLKVLKEMKEAEVRDLTKIYRSANSSEQKHKYHQHLVKAKQWLHLDNVEFDRLSSSSNELLRRSLENYLLSLTASDGHNNDALRCTALWLQHSESDIVNQSVSKYLDKVPSNKFASLMNQLTSRLLDSTVIFQSLLFQLVLKICSDHPYHGMYQIWAGTKTKSNTKDETAVSRQAATTKVGQTLASIGRSAKVWGAICATNKEYCRLAIERDETKYKQGQKIHLKDSVAGSALSNMLPRSPIPPPTMQIEIAVDLDYSRLPVMVKIEPQIIIASGVSAPKIITVVASNGSRFKQLVKGGNDDLRQDAIMEQVFSQVSELLATNTSTRQRNLGIRTYKVLPLTSNAGIIEFVSNTVPLHEYLMPAHERYYPKDLKGTQCRKEISDAQTLKLDQRIKKYHAVTEQFHPVMRYFFMEKFHDPDEWFTRRLAYTRSTAAISMLGHVLGLGDRHGHNILLDEKTGEAVHIDLGVAFEMGRVLPVPELVPFRLTRDIVDGMGISKTEGVFRRCCEFTLEGLRKDAYSIMTILDVLRYDPLYSWSISPVRLAKLQDAQSAAPLSSVIDAVGVSTKARQVVNEPSEADRALKVVEKKLSKTLSVTATVNDLINQATDEKNLAVLYSGWAAYV